MSAIMLGLLATSSCATPYQPMGFSGGYRDILIKGNTHYINVQVNGFTDATIAAGYFHRRAREICAASGFRDYDVRNERDTSTATMIGSYGGGGMSASTMNKPGFAGYIDCRD